MEEAEEGERCQFCGEVTVPVCSANVFFLCSRPNFSTLLASVPGCLITTFCPLDCWNVQVNMYGVTNIRSSNQVD